MSSIKTNSQPIPHREPPAASTVPQDAQEGSMWWFAYAAKGGWVPGTTGVVLTQEEARLNGMQAIIAALQMNGVPANLGDGVGVVLNIITDLLRQRDALNPGQWTARDPNDVLPEGWWWCSDGNLVWLLWSIGSPAQLAEAVRVKFYQPAFVPPPPR